MIDDKKFFNQAEVFVLQVCSQMLRRHRLKWECSCRRAFSRISNGRRVLRSHMHAILKPPNSDSSDAPLFSKSGVTPNGNINDMHVCRRIINGSNWRRNEENNDDSTNDKHLYWMLSEKWCLWSTVHTFSWVVIIRRWWNYNLDCNDYNGFKVNSSPVGFLSHILDRKFSGKVDCLWITIFRWVPMRARTMATAERFPPYDRFRVLMYRTMNESAPKHKQP